MNKKIKAKDRIGKTFNKLTIEGIEIRDFSGCRQSYAICSCSCGSKVTTRMSNVVSGLTKSCGCIKNKQKIKKDS